MSNQRFVDTGVIEGSMLEHFGRAAARMNARMAGLILMEPGKGVWGASPAEFQRNVAEQLAMQAEGFEAEQLVEGGKLEPVKVGGYPMVIEAAQNGTLRALVGIDNRGCRHVACAIIERGGAKAPSAWIPAPTVSRSSSPSASSSTWSALQFLFMGIGVLAAWWLWSRPASSLSENAKYGLVFLVIIVCSALAAWAKGRGDGQ